MKDRDFLQSSTEGFSGGFCPGATLVTASNSKSAHAGIGGLQRYKESQSPKSEKRLGQKPEESPLVNSQWKTPK
jgi:hypothetical protein